MKKTLIAMAALAATGASFAQVTLYGTIDTSYANYSSEGNTVSGLYNSQLASSKLGFTGSESLGGGLTANFKLEGGLASDNGAGKGSNTNNQASGVGVTPGATAAAATAVGGTQGLSFARYSYVGLSGGFGEVRLGRDYTSVFQMALATVDPLGTNGPGDASVMFLNLGAVTKQATAANVGNAIGYITPNMSGFSAKVQAWFGENQSTAANSGAGDGYSVAVNYAAGPLYIGAGQQMTKGTAALGTATALATGGDYTVKALSASYDLGVAKLAVTMAREELIGGIPAVGLTNQWTNNSTMVGVTVPMGAANLKAAYTRSALNQGLGGSDATGNLFSLGADYALSKRTKAFFAYGRVSNADGGSTYSAGNSGLSAVANNSSTGYALGVSHAF